MREFVKVASVADFSSGLGKMVTVDGRHLALFRLGDEFFALDNTCLHRGGPLCEGFVENNVVTCPWHGWSYDLRTGILVQDGRVGVSSHATRIVDGVVHVQLSS